MWKKQVLEHVSQCQIATQNSPNSSDTLKKSGYMHKCLLLTNILHSETFVIGIGDVVLAAELHAVGDPDGCVVGVEIALPI